MSTYLKLALVSVFFSFSLTAFAASDKSGGSIGFGLGLPYGGVLGFDITHTLASQLDLTMSVGAAYGLGWNVGGRYFFEDKDESVRATLLYGVNSAIITKDCNVSSFGSFCNEDIRQYKGLSAGFGWGPRAYVSGWDVDLFLILTSGAFDDVDRLQEQGYSVSKPSPIKLAVGYHWAF